MAEHQHTNGPDGCVPRSFYDEYVQRVENGLAFVYRRSSNDAAAIAVLCDEYIDRSGALLGRIRAAAYLQKTGKRL